jgi:tetratricopeptide (TPR) repeat protein
MSLTIFREAFVFTSFGAPMGEMAKVLAFRPKGAVAPDRREPASACAKAFLAMPRDQRSIEYADGILGDSDVLMALCLVLWDLGNTSPSDVAAEASQAYAWVSSRTAGQFLFDERDYFLGETALITAGASRMMGKRDETLRWLDRADAAFRHTLAPTAHLARVAYVRLALKYDMRQHEDVLDLLPSVALTFEKLGMQTDLSKCRFLEAVTLKELGRSDQAMDRFSKLVSDGGGGEPTIRGLALVNLGDLYSGNGDFERALASYAQAAPLFKSANRFASMADLKLMIATTLRSMGRLGASLDAYREATRDYEALGMSTRVAYIRVLLAEALLEAGRPREAEWEIVAALPAISRERMVPEGVAAVTLLEESVRQRRTDPRALLEVRELLRASS